MPGLLSADCVLSLLVRPTKCAPCEWLWVFSLWPEYGHHAPAPELFVRYAQLAGSVSSERRIIGEIPSTVGFSGWYAMKRFASCAGGVRAFFVVAIGAHFWLAASALCAQPPGTFLHFDDSSGDSTTKTPVKAELELSMLTREKLVFEGLEISPTVYTLSSKKREQIEHYIVETWQSKGHSEREDLVVVAVSDLRAPNSASTVFGTLTTFEASYEFSGAKRSRSGSIEVTFRRQDIVNEECPGVHAGLADQLLKEGFDDSQARELKFALSESTAESAALQSPSSQPTIDVLALYTPQSAVVAEGEAGILARMYQAIHGMNVALSRSAVDARMRLIGVRPLGEPMLMESEPDGWAADLVSLALRAEPLPRLEAGHLFREQLGADIVVALGDAVEGSSAAGMALPHTAFSIVDVRAANYGNGVVAHEIGHNLGLDHDLANASPWFPSLEIDNYGFHFVGNSGTTWGTIMSYVGQRILNFSNPGIVHDGHPTGTAQANNARIFRNAAPVVADWEHAPISISGQITDSEGRPLPDVMLESELLGTTSTNLQGRFVFETIMDGVEWLIKPRNTLYRFSPAQWSGDRLQSQELSFVGERQFEITGRVILDGDVHMPGVRIYTDTGYETWSDDFGNFRVGPLAANSYITLYASFPGYSFEHITVGPVNSDEVFDFYGVQDNVEISGCMHHSNGVAASGRLLHLTGVSAGFAFSATASTDSSGCYSFSLGASGELYTLRSFPPTVTWPSSYLLQPLTSMTRNFLVRPVIVAGRVLLDNGLPLENVLISTPGMNAFSGLDGRFQIANAQAGPTEVTFTKSGYRLSPSSFTYPEQGIQNLAITATPHNYPLNLTFTTNDTVDQARVNVSGVSAYDVTNNTYLGTSNAYGALQSSGLYGQQYEIQFSAPGNYQPIPARISGTISGALNVAVDVHVPPQLISGRVLEQGVGVPGVAIDGGPTGAVFTDNTGTFSFPAPYASSFVLSFSKLGYTFNPTSAVVNVPSMTYALINATDQRLPLTPSMVNASQGNISHPTSIRVHWASSALSTHYDIIRASSCAGPWDFVVGSVTSSSTEFFDTSGLISLEPVYYRVRSRNARGPSPLSEECALGFLPQPPSAPQNVRATSGTFNDRIRVNWNSSLSFAGYQVYGSSSHDGPYTMLANLDGINATEFWDVFSSSSYATRYYRVSARLYGSEATSPLSSPVQGSTTAPPSGTLVAYATQGTVPDRVTISWNSSGVGYSYVVQRAANLSGPWNDVELPPGITWPTGALSSHDIFSEPGVQWWYRVQGRNGSHLTEWSTPVAGWRMTIPTSPFITASAGVFPDGAVDANGITVQWDRYIGTHFVGYKLYRSASPQGPFTLVQDSISEVSETTYRDTTGLQPGHLYYYRVVCQSMAGTSPLSSAPTATGFRAIRAVTQVSASNSMTSRIRIQWSNPDPFYSSSLKYNIYRALQNEPLQLIAARHWTSQPYFYDDTTGVAGSVYRYTVQAVQTTSEIAGPASSEAIGYLAIAGGALPPIVSSASDGLPSLEIQWSPLNGASSYQISRAEYGISSLVVVGSVASNRFTDLTALQILCTITQCEPFGVMGP